MGKHLSKFNIIPREIHKTNYVYLNIVKTLKIKWLLYTLETIVRQKQLEI